jgi:uncharacterized Tic20 family protein
MAAEAEPLPLPAPESMSSNDEHTWAMLAHLSIFANLITGFLGPLIALVIYLVYKDRSRYIAYQSMQALVFQLIFWVGAAIIAAILWLISSLLLVVVCLGCLVMPPALFFTLLPLAALVYGAIAAIQCSQGEDFKYWLIGDWVRGIYEPPAEPGD